MTIREILREVIPRTGVTSELLIEKTVYAIRNYYLSLLPKKRPDKIECPYCLGFGTNQTEDRQFGCQDCNGSGVIGTWQENKEYNQAIQDMRKEIYKSGEIDEKI